MKFKVGDQVKFLNETGGGVVSEIVNPKMVKVMTGDGFEIPIAEKELIKSISTIDYDTRNNEEINNQIVVKSNQHTGNTDFESILPENVPKNSLKSALLGFVPKEKSSAGTSDINLYLINDAPFALIYFIGIKENVSWHFMKTGYLEPDTKLLLKSFDQSAISKIKSVHVQLLFGARGKYYPQSPVDKMIDLNNIRFYKESTYKENLYFHKKALILPVSDNFSEKLEESFGDELASAMMEKKEKKSEPTFSKLNETVQEEIDLHIEEITDQFSNLSAGEILEIQMNRFYAALENSIIHKQQRIIFIHGVGNGKLKFEIIKTLDEKYPDLKYQDASFKEYGYGATMVYLK